MTFRSGIPMWGARTAVAVLVLLPLFFQLRGTVYHSPKVPMYDSGGDPFQVPLPISILACVAGPLLLLRAFDRARVAFAFLGALAAAMILGAIITTFGSGSPKMAKALLLIQCLVPASAIVLGAMFEGAKADRLLARVFVYSLAVLVSLILYLTHVQGTGAATWNLEIFSIYQHRQYVPVVFVSAFLFGLYTLWTSKVERPLLIYLSLATGAYAGLSFSVLALALLLLGILAFCVLSRQFVLAAGLLVLCGLGMAATLWKLRDVEEFRVKFLSFWQGELQWPEYLSARIKDWLLYWRGIGDNGAEMLFGHAHPFDRALTTSAHNYYLDLAYNFGLLALLPVLALIGYTLWELLRGWRQWIRSDFGTCGLAFVVLFLVLVDSNFKVTLRQPYPGIFAFFLWGLLLARLRAGTTGAQAK